MTCARPFRPALLAGVAILVLATGSRAVEPPAPGSPLSNEDVVRMVAAGTPESEILEAIRARPAAFDVSDDMVAELELAGVPATIVAAMKAKQAHVAPAVPPPEPPRKGRTSLTVAIGASGARTLRVPAYANEDAKAMLHLPKETDQREARDMAVFLACATPEHVPDLWRSKTPLGRDMNLTVRHEMLVFVPGETPPGKAPRLTLPATLEAEVDDTEPHDLVLGVAALIGDRWIQLGAAVLPKAKVAPGGKPLKARIAAARPFEFKVEWVVPKP